MNLSLKIVSVAACVMLFGCREAVPLIGRGAEALARVGERELWPEDIMGIFTSGMTSQDSVKLLDSYIEMWVRKEVKILEAETVFGKDQADIERLVEDYRNSLLSNKLDQYWIDNDFTSEITELEIKEYYDRHMTEFLLGTPIVKGRIAVIPAGFAGRSRLKSLMEGNEAKQADFTAIMEKNDFELIEYDQWTDMAVFKADLGMDADHDFSNKKAVSEHKDGDRYYLVQITEYRGEGDISPLERVSDLIARILYNKRKSDIIKVREDSLVKVAASTDILEINNKK